MPLVSIIVPCFNEEKTIRLLLDALHAQTYPHQAMEVIIADGMSSDGTRKQVSAFQDECPKLQVRVIDNPQRTIPAALNRAIETAEGEIIVRLDAHSVPRPDYVARCVEALEAGQGDNVGGVWEIQPQGDSWQARSIAAAAAHPLWGRSLSSYSQPPIRRYGSFRRFSTCSARENRPFRRELVNK